MKPSSQLTLEARKILRKWTKRGFYCYLRPLDSRFIEGPKSKFKVHWRIMVEWRGPDFKQCVGEGYNLSEIIINLDPQVPRRPYMKPENFTTSIPKPSTVVDRPRRRPKKK